MTPYRDSRNLKGLRNLHLAAQIVMWRNETAASDDVVLVII